MLHVFVVKKWVFAFLNQKYQGMMPIGN